MAADPSRLVDVRGVLGDAPGGGLRVLQGSGLIVGPGLVLTAGHVVRGTDAWLPVRVRVAGGTTSYDAEVVWPSDPGELDLAILQVSEPPPGWPSLGVRWGRFTGRAGDRPVDAAGYPRVVRDDDGREVHHLVGRVNPQAGIERGRLQLEVSSEPSSIVTDPESPWAGFSGAALMSRDLVVGVVVIDTPGFAHRMLTAVPVKALLAFTEVRELLGVQSLGDSVELDDLLEPRSRIGPPRSPAQLLRAEQETIPFLGRDGELARLTRWADDRERLGVRLITGPGGRGKTRLAQELTHRLSREPGWVTGVLESRVKGHMDKARLLETTADLRVLLVVDYAESRVEQICEILCAAERAADPPHLRLLLLARDSGDWWSDDLLRRHDELEDVSEHISLPELHPFGERADQFVDCAQEFARRLPAIVPEVDWAERLQRAEPPDLTEAGYGDPLSIQLAAMLALLGGGHDGSLESRLIRHEKSYWQHVLEVRGINLQAQVRDQAVAAATLFSVVGRQAALRLLDRVPELESPGPVATWLAELYPHAKHYWGPLQPDRLGEHHIGDVCHKDPEFLHELFSTTAAGEAEAALVVIGRAMAHQPHLEGQVRRLVDDDVPGIAEAVQAAARFVPNPRLFLRGLGQRTVLDPDNYSPMHDSTPLHSPAPARTIEGLDADAFRLQTWLDDSRDRPRESTVQLALELVDNRVRASKLDEAMSAAQQAVSWASSMGDAQLGKALTARSGVEADLGQLEQALATSQEAVEVLLRKHTAEPDPTGVAEELGRAMSNLAALMQRAGRNQEAHKYSSEALAYLADVEQWYADPQVRLRAQVTHASIQASLSMFADAKSTLQATIIDLDRSIGADPMPHPDAVELRAAAKSNLGACLDEMGEYAGAIPALAESIDDYATLDDTRFAREIARAAMGLAEIAARRGDTELAVEAAQRCITEISRWQAPTDSSTESSLRDALLSRASRILGDHS